MLTGSSAIQHEQSRQVNSPDVYIQGPMVKYIPSIPQPDAGGASILNNIWSKVNEMNFYHGSSNIVMYGAGTTGLFMGVFGLSSLFSGQTHYMGYTFITSGITNLDAIHGVKIQRGDNAGTMDVFWGTQYLGDTINIYQRIYTENGQSLVMGNTLLLSLPAIVTNAEVYDISKYTSGEDNYMFFTQYNAAGTPPGSTPYYQLTFSKNNTYVGTVGKRKYGRFTGSTLVAPDYPANYGYKALLINNNFYSVYTGITSPGINKTFGTFPTTSETTYRYIELEKLSTENRSLFNPTSIIFEKQIKNSLSAFDSPNIANSFHIDGLSNPYLIISDITTTKNGKLLPIAHKFTFSDKLKQGYRYDMLISRSFLLTGSSDIQFAMYESYLGLSYNFYMEWTAGTSSYISFSHYNGQTPLVVIDYNNSNNNSLNMRVSNTNAT